MDPGINKFIKAKGLKLFLINDSQIQGYRKTVQREESVHRFPINLKELSQLEGSFTTKGYNVKFYYEDNTGDDSRRIPIEAFADYMNAVLNHMTCQGLIIIYELTPTEYDAND